MSTTTSIRSLHSMIPSIRTSIVGSGNSCCVRTRIPCNRNAIRPVTYSMVVVAKRQGAVLVQTNSPITAPAPSSFSLHQHCWMSTTDGSSPNERSFISGLSYMKNRNSGDGSSSNKKAPIFTPIDDSMDNVSTNPIDIANELLDFADHVQTSTNSSSSDDENAAKQKQLSSSSYNSPMQAFFDEMYRNGPTTLGTTDEILQYEKQVIQQQKVLSCGILESKLRFTTTSYGRTMMAPFVHNNEHRVICKVNISDLPFTTQSNEYQILQEIVGTQRLNIDRNELRLTSNQFGSRIENKRHLVSMMDRIILSCKRLAAELPSSSSLSSPPPPQPSITSATTGSTTNDSPDAIISNVTNITVEDTKASS